MIKQKCKNLSGKNLEVDVIDSFNLTEALINIFGRYYWPFHEVTLYQPKDFLDG